MISRYFRYADGVIPNLAIFSATLLGYPLGVLLLTQPFWLLKLAGCALLAIALTWSAYLIHECAHQSIFKTAGANERWGTVMSWINGSCYARFSSMRRKHMRHHVERADVITFDVQGFLRQAPAWQRNTVLALEWLYFPAVEFLMRAFVLALPFMSQQPITARLRILAIFSLRCSAFVLLGWHSKPALALYFLAYLIFVTLMRFADCFQHTYVAYPIIGDAPIPPDMVRDKAYEQANTYSDIVGIENRFLNLLWLNFGYHNAHHDKPAMPWHRLPEMHRALYSACHAQVVPVHQLLKSFHVNRVKRILAKDCGHVLPHGAPGRADQFLGAVGVSFLTAV